MPARTAVARTLTRWARAAGWSGAVHGVAGGFEVAGSSGRRSLVPDLGTTIGRLHALGVSGDDLLAASTSGVVDGPPTRPGPRPRREPAGPPTAGPTRAGPSSPGAAAATWTLAPDPRRHYRLPGLLAWFAAAHAAEVFGVSRTIQLGLGGAEGVLLRTAAGGGTTCDAAPAPGEDLLVGPDDDTSARLVALLCPAGAALG